MILQTHGKAINIEHDLVGKVTRSPEKLDKDSFLLLDSNNSYLLSCKLDTSSFLCILSDQNEYLIKDKEKVIYAIKSTANFEDGDILLVKKNGYIITLYRVNSDHNTLLVTELCNSNCLMCSQPPKKVNDIKYLITINEKLIKLIPKSCKILGISGGEPTLMGNSLLEFLSNLKTELPNTDIHLLSNGRLFSNYYYVEKLANLKFSRLLIGIPIYSDYYQIHDYIVQSKYAFYQTILGLYNLATFDQRIELRIVLNKLSCSRLEKLSKFIYKNLPFVEHIAFMGLECIGHTISNLKKLWIEPFEFQSQLYKSVNFLAGQGFNVSIYNIPLCQLPSDLWNYSRKSISDWKVMFNKDCEKCSMLDRCSGFFQWNLKYNGKNIKPIV